ncbi:MAG TPA: pyridoxine 5'-phosphate synthase [Vicinamibacterales bacterium]|nr:pyridoxine 5'-phosphate synthase [Vicinamibacterales bacterium]
MPSIKLSVNVNKVATLRNSRGGREPDVLQAVAVCVGAGAPGITVHPRADERHIRKSDVHAVAELLKKSPQVEFNIEGDPRPELLDLVLKVRPTQCTLVPVKPGEITSQAGWPAETPVDELKAIVEGIKKLDVRVSIFVDPVPDSVKWAATVGGDRVELYTEPFARAFEAGRGEASFETYAKAAELAHSLGLGINAGHDLDLKNLTLFRRLPHLEEVSIGHALVSHALYVGLERSVRDYLDALR